MCSCVFCLLYYAARFCAGVVRSRSRIFCLLSIRSRLYVINVVTTKNGFEDKVVMVLADNVESVWRNSNALDSVPGFETRLQ